MKIKGKQIKDAAITQQKLNVTTASVTAIDKVNTKEWADQNIVNHINTLTHSQSNLDMTALATTVNTGSQLACNNGIVDVPQSTVIVRVNGVDINVGGTTLPYDGFFSPDGTVVRAKGAELQGDKLYWNTTAGVALYQLEVTDKIDFVYLIKTAYAPF
jgi:hypothetical protein